MILSKGSLDPPTTPVAFAADQFACLLSYFLLKY